MMSHQRLDSCFSKVEEYITTNNVNRLDLLKESFMTDVKREFTEGQVLIGKYITDSKYSFNNLGSFLDDCKQGSWSYAKTNWDKAKKEYNLFVEVLEKSMKNADNMRKPNQRGDTTNDYTENVTIESKNMNKKPVTRTTIYSPNRDQSDAPTITDNHQIPTRNTGNQVSSTSAATNASHNQWKYEHDHQYQQEKCKHTNQNLKSNSGRIITQGPESVSLEEKDLTSPSFDAGRRLEAAQKEDYERSTQLQSTKDSTVASYYDKHISEEEKRKKESKYEYGYKAADIYRRSEEASILLRDNNPNITDLSDSNRPTKLAERFSELYSNEHTDAFEELARYQSYEGMMEYNLLRVVRYAYKHCQEWNQKVDEELRMKQLEISKSDDQNIIFRGKHQAEKKRNAEDTKDVVVQMFMDNVVPLLLKDLSAATKHAEIGNAQSKYRKYAAKCVEIVWWMCVQNPPIHLEWLQQPRQIFDSEFYRSYTKSGQYVDFCVWPLVRLYKKGPVLSKGIAQGIN